MRKPSLTIVVSCCLVICSFSWLKTRAQVDFRIYYIESIDSIYNTEGIDRLNALKHLRKKHGRLLPFDVYRVGLVYDELNQQDSAKIYFDLAIENGFAVYRKDLIEKYNLCDLRNGNQCAFNAKSNERISNVNFMLRIDQAIRKTDVLDSKGISFVDSIFSSIVFTDSLLSFSKVGFVQQQKSWIIALHCGLPFHKDSTYIRDYLIGLVKAGELTPYYCASILDKYYFSFYGYQKYGTFIQNTQDSDTVTFTAPFLDVNTVDQNRKQVGLLGLERWWHLRNKVVGKLEEVNE